MVFPQPAIFLFAKHWTPYPKACAPLYGFEFMEAPMRLAKRANRPISVSALCLCSKIAIRTIRSAELSRNYPTLSKTSTPRARSRIATTMSTSVDVAPIMAISEGIPANTKAGNS